MLKGEMGVWHTFKMMEHIGVEYWNNQITEGGLDLGALHARTSLR